MNLSSWTQWKCTTFRCFPMYFDMFTGVIYKYAFVHCSWNQAVYYTRVFMINKQPILLLFDYSIPRRASGNCQSTHCSSRCDDCFNVSLLLFEVYFKTSILNPQFFTTVQTIFLFKNDGNYVESINQVNQVVILHLQM